MPRDLAGLAALGTLGYMLANRKKNPDVDTSGVSDMDLTGGARSMTPDTGELRDETGALSKLRRNTETGDLYSPNEPITRPSASSVASVQKVVRNPSGMAGQKVRGGNGPTQIPSGAPDTSDEGAGTESDFAPSMKINKNPTSRIGEYLKDLTSKKEKHGTYKDISTGKIVKYAKGGATGKVVKMAKGGVTRSSASSRADGIATKGRTKGRYL